MRVRDFEHEFDVLGAVVRALLLREFVPSGQSTAFEEYDYAVLVRFHLVGSNGHVWLLAAARWLGFLGIHAGDGI